MEIPSKRRHLNKYCFLCKYKGKKPKEIKGNNWAKHVTRIH